MECSVSLHNKISLRDLEALKKSREIPRIDQISLKLIVEYFEKYIMPYRYFYTCDNDLSIVFSIEKGDLCHLLYGSLDNLNIKRPTLYKGEPGYNAIKDGTITLDNMHTKLKDKCRDRIRSFVYLDTILENPKVVYFNPQIVARNDYSIGGSIIDAKFLFYKMIGNKNLHFFLKNKKTKKRTIIKSCSFFPQRADNYIIKQIPLTVYRKEKRLK